ncbi:MAG: hypothetical protein ABIZ04_14115 [Opitutus sp.]
MSDRIHKSVAPIALLRRFGAAVGIALLLLISASAASPALHQWLHADSGFDASDNCAVVLFASGVTIASALIALTGSANRWIRLRPLPIEEVLVVSPRYLRLPERGPPEC